jgi:F-type H+-transporting ATPase subunit alpha
VISITDGQIFLESDLFYSGIRPAINVGLSVSRVGGAAQIKAMKKVSSSLRLDLAQYYELVAFSQFGSDLDKATKALLNRGERMVEILKQPQYSPMPVEEQFVSIFLATQDYLVDVPTSQVTAIEQRMLIFFRTQYADLLAQIKKEKVLSEELKAKISCAMEEFKKQV